MKLWLDDIRPAPDGWLWAKTAEDAIRVLHSGDVTEVSLDHDLGRRDGRERTGYDVLTAMEWMTYHHWHSGWRPPAEIHIHTGNPVGRRRMEAARDSVRKLAAEMEAKA